MEFRGFHPKVYPLVSNLHGHAVQEAAQTIQLSLQDSWRSRLSRHGVGIQEPASILLDQKLVCDLEVR